MSPLLVRESEERNSIIFIEIPLTSNNLAITQLSVEAVKIAGKTHDDLLRVPAPKSDGVGLITPPLCDDVPNVVIRFYRFDRNCMLNHSAHRF